MKIKVTTGIRLTMSFGVMTMTLAITEYLQGKSDLETTLVGIVGCTLLFGGFALIGGIRNFGWDVFKKHVLLQPVTGIWLVCAAALGIIASLS